MRVLFCVTLIALTTIGACASMRDEVISGFCGASRDDEPQWTRIGPPANAESYRALARSDPSVRARGDEYWFARSNGQTKYCVTPLRRASTIPERNGSNCDDRLGVWWVFDETQSGPVTRGVEERICIT